MPHQLLLHTDRRTGLVQSRPIRVAERVPADRAELFFRGQRTALVVDRNLRKTPFPLEHHCARRPRSCGADGTGDKAPSRRTEIVLLNGRGVIAMSGDGARETTHLSCATRELTTGFWGTCPRRRFRPGGLLSAETEIRSMSFTLPRLIGSSRGVH